MGLFTLFYPVDTSAQCLTVIKKRRINYAEVRIRSPVNIVEGTIQKRRFYLLILDVPTVNLFGNTGIGVSLSETALTSIAICVLYLILAISTI